MAKSTIIVDKFSTYAPALRRDFESRFANPHSADADRFVWDYWHVPNQYTLLRTPAYHFFDPKIYEAFHNQLVWWGRRNLGCHDVSPPWLSCYVDGCKQELHGDLPHGPWAFVFSLTPWRQRRFKGGETYMLRDSVLSYWQEHALSKGLEQKDLFQDIAPKMNRLLVFDPRIPHGVRKVKGVFAPNEGRLVIHGWFVQPRPFVEGPLSTKELSARIEELNLALAKVETDWLKVQGLLSLKIHVLPSGTVRDVRVLCSNLRPTQSLVLTTHKLQIWLIQFWQQQKFSKKSKASHITLPLVFEPEV